MKDCHHRAGHITIICTYGGSKPNCYYQDIGVWGVEHLGTFGDFWRLEYLDEGKNGSGTEESSKQENRIVIYA
jgi:hypothetical protein